MKLLRVGSIITLAFACLGLGTAAHAVVIDFDGLDSSSTQTPLNLGPGAIAGNGGTFTEDGFTFSVSVSSNDTPPRAVIFDSTCAIGAANPYAACNGDVDLTPATQGENGIEGNILIVQEQGSAIPDDAGRPGGTITLTFEDGTPFRFTGASIIDDETITIYSVIGGAMIELASETIGIEGDVGGTALLNAANGNFIESGIFQVGDSIVIDFSGSGGIDSLVLAPVPLPAALPLLLSALGGLGLTARLRRKREA